MLPFLAGILAWRLNLSPPTPILVRSARNDELRPAPAAASVYGALSSLIADNLFEQTSAAEREQLVQVRVLRAARARSRTDPRSPSR